MPDHDSALDIRGRAALVLVALISTVNETHITAAQFQERYAEVAGLETNVTSAGETARAILDVLNTSRTGELLIL